MSNIEIIRNKKHWLTVLQITDRDPDGKPRGYRILYDNETVDAAKAAEDNTAHFIIVWAPLDQNANEQTFGGSLAEMETLRDQQAELKRMRIEQERDLRRIEGDVARLEADNDKKTEELRRLNKERDPDRIAREVAAQVGIQTVILRAELSSAKTENQGLTAKVTELQASKRKLREALERERSAK